jgi:hypothetical protein
MTGSRWKVVQIVISIKRMSRPSSGTDWDWKAPFMQLKRSTIRGETEWQLLLQVADGEEKSIYKLCDGRHQVETVMEEVPQELWNERIEKLYQDVTGETGQNVDIKV